MDDRPRYMISVAADLVGMHPQTLRIYEDELGKLRARLDRLEREMREQIERVHRQYRRDLVLYRQAESRFPARRKA
jgi:ABC-type Zn uptake system ZnuABC Zn-binding protein ZnuA